MGYEGVAGHRDYAVTEKIVQWCQLHDVIAEGHPLAGNWQEPSRLPRDPDQALRLQFARIKRCVGEFRGKVDIWDAVNEATHYDRPERKAQVPTVTEAIRRVCVPAYIRAAFRMAREANARAVPLGGWLVARGHDCETGLPGIARTDQRQMVDTEPRSCRGDREAGFRGFFGDYKVMLEDESLQFLGTFSFDQNTRGPLEVRLK